MKALELLATNVSKNIYCSLLTDYGIERGQHTSNKALARYLSRSNPDYDDYLAKRAMFRKRGMKFISKLRVCVF